VGAGENAPESPFAQDASGLDPVHRSRKPYVHQHEVGPLAARQVEGFLSGGGDGDHSIAGFRQGVLEGEGDEVVVLHDQDPLAPVATCFVSRFEAGNVAPPGRAWRASRAQERLVAPDQWTDPSACEPHGLNLTRHFAPLSCWTSKLPPS
jgi:hypothetical protein